MPKIQSPFLPLSGLFSYIISCPSSSSPSYPFFKNRVQLLPLSHQIALSSVNAVSRDVVARAKARTLPVSPLPLTHRVLNPISLSDEHLAISFVSHRVPELNLFPKSIVFSRICSLDFDLLLHLRPPSSITPLSVCLYDHRPCHCYPRVMFYLVLMSPLPELHPKP